MEGNERKMLRLRVQDHDGAAGALDGGEGNLLYACIIISIREIT